MTHFSFQFRRHFLIPVILILFTGGISRGQVLKSIVYDFDGLDIGATDLPEGDYQTGDMRASVAANPLPPNDMVGDRCMQLNLKWAGGTGQFGRGIARYIEFDASKDHINFFFYNPASNNQNAEIELNLGDDDNQDNKFDGGMDDIWRKTFSIPANGGWQLFSVPLSQMTDANSGGNGVFDMAFTGNKGMLMLAEVKFSRPVNAGEATFYIDMISFSEGPLPQGGSPLSLPGKDPSDYCLLGAFSNESTNQYYLTPSKFEALFPQSNDKKIRYVNTFIQWSMDSAAYPYVMPGSSAQTLLNNGYTPIITWEALYANIPRLHPKQPRLQNILNGEYNSYIDAFADECRKLSDTIIIRFMHEFEGDWYPWSITHNGKDPGKYAATYRAVVERFRARGANNVKWMWCVNSDYAPYEYTNFIKDAYPGDNYVNIVATDIYNNHYPIDLPWWRSFRWQTTETYYYLTKYFPNKPLYICEVGCRERFSSENTASESKGAWYARMDKELQSNFHKAKALIFFHANPDQNWLVNSSPYAVQSLSENIWNDDYYFKTGFHNVTAKQDEDLSEMFSYPNPSDGLISIGYVSNSLKESYTLRVVNSQGQTVTTIPYDMVSGSFSTLIDMSTYPRGIYYVELRAKEHDDNKKQIKLSKKIALI